MAFTLKRWLPVKVGEKESKQASRAIFPNAQRRTLLKSPRDDF